MRSSTVPDSSKLAFSLRSIGEAGSDFIRKNGALAIADSRARLVPKGYLMYTWDAYQIPTRFPTKFKDHPPSVDVAAEAVLVPGNPRPSEVDANILHITSTHARGRLLKATARELGVTLTRKLGTCEGVPRMRICVTLLPQRQIVGQSRSRPSVSGSQ